MFQAFSLKIFVGICEGKSWGIAPRFVVGLQPAWEVRSLKGQLSTYEEDIEPERLKH
jgi:hypothetical protein